MAKVNLSAERLRELLDYNAETGIFTRRLDVMCGRNGKQFAARAGDRVGTPSGQGANGNFRLVAHLDGRLYKMHRLAWLYVHGEWPVSVIDHVNGNASDNRIANLRDVSRAVNQQNRRKPASHNKSGILGVTWLPLRKEWVARIRINGKTKAIGYYNSSADAQAAYLTEKRLLHEGCTI